MVNPKLDTILSMFSCRKNAEVRRLCALIPIYAGYTYNTLARYNP